MTVFELFGHPAPFSIVHGPQKSYNSLMQVKKIFFAISLVFVCLFPSFSLGGALSESSSPLHVIRTEYFDIIFPEECRESAQKIEAVCDDYYLEITGILETEPYQRFPVTITRTVEQLNAYYSAVPYNRIVLFETLPEKSLDMYENTIQKVFYHELTHAVTYNMKDEKILKSKRYKMVSFMGDVMTPAWLTITTFWAEGATVSLESMDKGGRLNDPFATQMVNQSVIEGHFPSWRDVTGARDTYPGGTDAYMFGSMFASYLQETYGMSKYAEFWKNAGSKLPLSLIAGIFKKTYGIKISDAWNDFEKTLTVQAGEKDAKLLSKKKSRVTALDFYFDKESGETKIAYFDNASASLRLLTISNDGKVKKNKKLLAIKGLTRVAFSPDGTKLALSRTVDKKNVKCVLAEYDLKKGHYKENSLNARREGYFRLKDGNEELVSVRIDGGKASGNAVVLLNEQEIPFCPLAIDNNLYAAIIKEGLSWKIRLFDSKNVLSEWDFSKIAGEAHERNLIPHNLHLVSADSGSIFLSFTWAELGMGGKMLSRAGFVKIDRDSNKATAFLQKENNFAGLVDAFPEESAKNLFDDETSAASDEGSEGFSIYLIAAEYDKNPLYRMELRASDFEKVSVPLSGTIKGDAEGKATPASETEQAEHKEISYNPLRYYRRGIFVPGIGMVPVYNHDFGLDTTTILGMTYVSSNPWGDKLIYFSGGYDVVYKAGGMRLDISGGDDSLKYSLESCAIFDKDGFLQTSETLQLTKTLWSGKVSNFSVGMKEQFLYGKQICDDDLEKGRDDSKGKSADAKAFVEFSNIHKVSPAYYNYAGLSLAPFVLTSYRDSEKRLISDKYINAGAEAQIKFPILVPFIFTASLFPTEKYACGGSVKVILFDFEVHKGIPAIPLFVQRFVLSATYAGKISYVHDEFLDCKRTQEIFENVRKEDYSDSLRFDAKMHLSPNTGFFANDSIQFSLGYAMIYRPNPKVNEKRVAYGITTTVNY